jgi:hypothetical protein
VGLGAVDAESFHGDTLFVVEGPAEKTDGSEIECAQRKLVLAGRQSVFRLSGSEVSIG